MTAFSEDLLRKYNKRDKTYEPATTIATISYANMYDALYERFRDNRNFSTEAWNQAIKLGKQDTYFTLLEKNKDVDMSDEFYDPLYYNYEGTMLELYKTSADNNIDNAKEYFVEKYDPRTNKYIQESIGELTDSQYIQYQLDNLREAQSAKIARDLEEQRKQNMSELAKVANTAGAVAAEFGEGVTTGITGILDFALGLGWATGAAIDGKNWLDSYVDYFGTKGLTAQSKATFRASLDEWERKNTFIRNIDGEMEPVGKYLAGISNSIGMMVPSILANIVAPGIGMPLFYSSIYTNNLYENANNPDTKNSPSWLKVTNAATKAAVEAVVEWGLAKVLGSTVQNKMLGLTSKFGTASVLKPLGKFAGAKYLAKSALQEGLEEFLQDFSTNLVDQFTGMIYDGYQNTGVNFQTLMDSLVIGALSSLVMSGGKIAQNSISNRIAKTTDGKYGTAYPVIETKDGELENIRGAKQLAWSDMMSDFMAAIDTLKNGKVDIDKNLELAEEVYGGITILTQLYSSFDADRIKNSEKLLQRLAKSEQTAKENAARIVEVKTKMKDSDYTDVEIQFAKEYSKQIKNRDRADFKDIRVEFANKLEGDVKDMLGGVYSRYAKRIAKAIIDNAEKLQENGVTEVVSVTSKDHNVKKDPAITELDNILQGKNDELLTDYECIFGTDGHVAIEVDKMLFVPVAWLENYEVSEIYKYLAQEQLLSGILEEKALTKLVDELVKHNKEFTKNENVTRERALMDLLFNKSVFQHFLLSESGKNLHEFKNLIFTLFSSMKLSGKTGIQLQNILEEIKQAWNEPLLKAIINWNMDVQKLGADILLSDADKAFINKYQARKRMSIVAAKGGAIPSEHRRLVKDLIERGEFTDEEEALIEKGLKDDAPNNDRLKAVMLLNLADDRYVNLDDEKENSFSGAFVLPPQAFSTDIEMAAITQMKTDAINEFEKTYGISARALMLSDITTLTQTQQNKIQQEMETLHVDNLLDFVLRKLEVLLGDEYIVTPTYDVASGETDSEQGIDTPVIRDFEIVKKIPADQLLVSNIVNPPSGTQNEAFLNMFEKTDEGYTPRRLGDFLQTETDEHFSDWTVKIINNSSKRSLASTSAATKTITINLAYSEDYVYDFVHEMNHVIQFEYKLTRGFSLQRAKEMPKLLEYVTKNYRELIVYYLRRDGRTIDADILAEENNITVSENFVYAGSYVLYIKPIVALIAYKLIQGEVWAEHQMHNGKPVKAFGMLQDTNGDSYVISPDGKEKFKIPGQVEVSPARQIEASSDKIQIDNALASQFDEILSVRGAGYDNDIDTRNTYHARLSRKSASELIQNILNKNLPITVRAKVTIDEIILSPEQYLSQEILDYISKKGEINEGNVYYGLKQWFEDNIDGVSIDRDGITHEYIFVDDNAFDDILTPEFNGKIHDDSNNDLVTKYTSEDGIGLNRLYKLFQLSLLGLPSNIKVVINDKVVSETVIDKNHKQGLITIHVDKNTTNAELIDTLNHEFRHLLQYYSGFETGFTPNFVVTKEMLADIKKHVPEIFNKETRAWAKLNGSQDTDTFIAQRFVYYMIGGEQNAYGFKSAWLNAKPAFVTKEAGKPTIFMPWYDAKTGDGRYITDFLASRADDKKGGMEIPRVDRKPKHKKLEIIDKGDEGIERKYTYERDRFFSKEKAKGTNLEGFKQDMDPDLQDFIIATTGNNDKLPKELRYAIEKKKLTLQAFYKYFRNAKTEDINDFTFDLINRYMFKNSTIKNMKELDDLVSLGETKHGKGGLAFWWAAAIVLRKEGLEIESLVKENDVGKFINFVKSLEGSKWTDKIEKVTENFNWYYVQNKKTGKIERKEIGLDQATSDYMRVFTMQFFDGSLAGAFYTARTLRRIVRLYQNKSGIVDLDRTVGEDADVTMKDFITEDGLIGDAKQYGNDIIAMYEAEVSFKSTDEMIAELVRAARPIIQKRAQKLLQQKNDLTDEQHKKSLVKLVNTNLLKFGKQLLEMSPDDIAQRYEQIRIAKMTGLQSRVDITDTSRDLGTQQRKNVVACIKRYGTNIIKFVSQGKIVWSNLPLEVRNMFEETTEKVKGKKVTVRTLKPEVYSVGHVKGKGKGRVASDMTQILKNKDLLRQVSYDAKRNVFASKETAKEVEVLQKKVNKTTRELLDAKGEIKTLKKQAKMKAAEFEVRGKKSKISDTPNNFTIISPVQMPTVLYKIFDVSFAEMANNEVVFASVDKDGNLLTEETDRKKFNSALKHEVANWDAFYEATRPFLLELTRNDVLDIVESIHNGLATTNGPAGKLAAFQIFVLGYIYDGAKRNINNWNFSEAEVDVIRKLYENKASEHGSGLNAVGQMLKVIDPMKKVRQRMLDDYGITDAELEPLFAAVDNLQTEKDLAKRKEKALKVADLLHDIELKMAKGDPRKKGLGKRWYQKTKSARYTFMLSSPMTWIRNTISNVAVEGLTKGSDVIGNLIFKGIGKKAYRENQWDLATTKTSTKTSKKVYQFIEDNVKNSELFDLLYDGSTKYDDRAKDVVKQRDLFVTMITRAIERKYAAEHRFDADTANNIAKFVNNKISDKRFIKRAVGRYLGKILTIEVERGNVTLDDGLSNTVLDLFAEALILANEDYMHKRSFMADMVDSLKEKHPFWYEVLNWWQPFLNSSFNWFQETLKYTPVGLVSAIYKMSTLEKQITKMDERRARGELVSSSKMTEYLIRRDIGKGVIGLGLLTLGIMLGAFGRIRIDEEDDKFYIKTGNLKIDISNIFGTSSVLIGVSLAQVGKRDFDDIMKYVAENMFEGFLLKDMLDRHKWNKGFYEGLLTETESVLRSFVPQVVQLMIRSTNNKKIRYSAGMKGMWERWLNTWIPTQPLGERKVNPYTGEIETKYAIPIIGEWLKSGLLGPKIFWTEVDELEAFAKEYGVNKNEINPEITINGERVSLGDKEKLNEYYGKLNKKSLAELQEQKHYVQMSDGSFKTLSWSQMNELQRARVIDKTMIQNAEISKIYTWTQVMNNKYQADGNFWNTLRGMGITKNVYKGEKGFVKQK